MDNSYSLQGERRYQSIFEHSTVSLWEEDISLLRSRVNGLVSRGITDLRSYLVEHPEFVHEAVRSIQVIDVNKATLRLYEAERKEQLLGPLKIALDEQAVESFREMIIALVEGRREIETESTAQSLRGKKLSLITKSYLISFSPSPCLFESPPLEVHLRCFFVRSPAGYWTYRLAAYCKHDIQDATGASRADSDPALFVSLHLVFQKDVISGQHIFCVRATDLMLREMPFILFVPVELGGISHWI